METVMNEIAIQKYPAYKDSGEEWIGEIPEHWVIKPGFSIIEERSEKNTGLKESTVLTLSYGSVKVKPVEKLTGLVPESFETYQLVYPGDIIIRPTDLQNDKTSLRTGLAKNKGIITSAYINIKVKSNNSSSFYHYFLHAVDITKVIYGLGTGLRQNLGFDEFKRFKFIFPPPAEQTAIANFLDRKTALLDQAIGIKEKQIELLKERRQILIHRAVTRGLNPNVKMKDSGVEWIGEVPEGWEVKRLMFLLNEYNVRSETGDEELLSLSKYQGVIPKSSLEERAGQAESLVGYKKVLPYDLVINKMQAVNGLIAVSKIQGITSPDYSIYRSKDKKILNIEYLCLLILQPHYLGEFKRRVTGVMEGFIRLYTDDLYNVFCTLPSIEEQNQIISHIETLNEKVEKTVSLKQQEIEKLKEYKASLINSAVTGKIKVC